MANSSLANAIKRKTHKERSQPAARTKYGLLEKHKDYVLRAKDFHKKERVIKLLKRKAEERNPDEFYFAMEKKRTKNGVHIGSMQEANKYTAEELALMKSQDVKYVTLKSRVEAEKIKAMQNTLHFIGAAPQNKHTVFMETAAEAREFDAAKHFDTPEELLGRTFNRPRTAQLSDPLAVLLPPGKKVAALALKAEKRKLASYRELQQRLERHTKLARTAAHLSQQKEVAGKGRKRKISKQELSGHEATGTGEEQEGGQKSKSFKWKRERKT